MEDYYRFFIYALFIQVYGYCDHAIIFSYEAMINM